MAAEPFGSSAVIGACQYLHIMIELAETTVVSRDKEIFTVARPFLEQTVEGSG